METDDDDIRMHDVPVHSAPRTGFPSRRGDYRSFSNRPTLPSQPVHRDPVANGFQGPRFLSRTFDGTGDDLHHKPVNGHSSRETSVLAQSTSNLSIEHAKPTKDQLNDYLTDLEQEEQDIQQPYLSELPTGYCYDVRMRYHTELNPPENRRDYHPEDPRRIFIIYKELCIAGLIGDPLLTRNPVVSRPLSRIDVRNVTEDEVELVHDQKHWELMRSTTGMQALDLLDLGARMDSVYFSGSTFDCARLAAGGAIECARAVMMGDVKNAFAIVRPPGHHAECNRSMGFCHFDNVSIATRVCQREFGDLCRKILILDWDVHHGNGIQQAFYQDPNVLYISIHVHEGGNFYPSGNYGDHKHMGAGEGHGRNINIPWPTKGMGDADYIFAFQQVVMPIAYEFDPDLVMIAAGFDAADGDQLGGCFVSPACYAHMTHMLKSLANGRVVACLEGGYNLRSISRSALAVVRTMNGEMPPRMEDRRPTQTAVSICHLVRGNMSQFWDCLYPKRETGDILEELEAASDTSHRSSSQPHSFDEVVQSFMAEKLSEKFDMVPLPLNDPELGLDYRNQVFLTPNYNTLVPLLVIMHVPPQAKATTDPINGIMDMSQSTLESGAHAYIGKANAHGWCVIDINVSQTTLQDPTDVYKEISNGKKMDSAAKIAEKVWDRYIDFSRFKRVFFLGIGRAYEGYVWLMNHRREFWNHVDGTVAVIPSKTFTEHNFPSSNNPTDLISATETLGEERPRMYHNRSLNFVGMQHRVWSLREGKRKPPKKYGRLVQSQETGLQQMMDYHFNAIWTFFEERCGGDLDAKAIMGLDSATRG